MNADRNLLFGILALQLDFVTREQLVTGMSAWLRDKSKGLGELFVSQNAMNEDQKRLLDALVEKHIEKHGGSVELSLQQISSIDPQATQSLREVADTELAATLQHIDSSHSHSEPSSSSKRAGSYSSSRFRILRPHAKGGLGEVYVAEDVELNRHVALKEIQGRFADNVESRERFLREAEITGNLEHPGIVPVYGLGKYDNGRPFYAMRFIRGQSLKEAIDAFHAKYRGRLMEGEAGLELRKLLGRLVDVCNAMAYAHSRGVLHRDLKPGNIILGNYGETLVVDWGLAKAQGQNESVAASLDPVTLTSDSASAPTISGFAIGTPAYMSPEQAAGRIEDLSAATDVYSLGATLFHILTGEVSVVGKSAVELVRKASAGDVRRPRELKSDIPKSLEAVCMKAMSKVPGDRYSSPVALAEDLEKWLADEPVSVYVEPLSTRLRRWIRRHPVVVSTSAACIVLGLCAATIVAYQEQSHAAALADKNFELTLANQKAEEARRRAEDRERDAIDAVKRFGDAIADNAELKNSANLEPLRKELLKEPIGFFRTLRERLRADKDPRPESLARLANAAFDLGELTDEIGDKQDSILAHTEAQRIREELVREEPDSRERRRRLADSHHALGLHLHALGRTAETLKYYELSKEIREQLVQEDPSEKVDQRALASIYNNIGLILRATGDYAGAMAAYQQAEPIRKQLAVEDSQDVDYQVDLASTQNNMGILLDDINQKSDALIRYREAQATLSRLMKENDPSDAEIENVWCATTHNIGLLLAELGETDNAIAAFEEVIRIREQLVQNHPSTTQYQVALADSLTSLGNLFRSLARFEEAADVYRQAKDINLRLVAQNPSVTEFQSDLARFYTVEGQFLHLAGNPLQAIDAHEKSKQIRAKLAANNPLVPDLQDNLAASIDNLATLNRGIGNYEEAITGYRAAISIREQLAVRNPSVVHYQDELTGCYINLGLLYSDRGKNESALELFRKAQAVQEPLARENPRVQNHQRLLANAKNCIANELGDLGETDEALKVYDEAIAIQRRVVLSNPSVVDYQSDLALTLYNQGITYRSADRWDEAMDSYRESIGIRERLAAENPRVQHYRCELADGRAVLGNIYSNKGDSKSAIAEYAQAQEIFERLVEESPLSTEYRSSFGLLLYNLALELRSSGKREDALAAQERSVTLQKQLVEENPDELEFKHRWATGLSAVALLKSELGSPDEAMAAYEEVIPVLTSLAEENPDLLELKNDLADSIVSKAKLTSRLGDVSVALDLLARAKEIIEGLANEDPAVPGYRSALADVYDYIGGLHGDAGRAKEALAAYAEAQSIQEALVEQSPDIPGAQYDLAFTLNNAAVVRMSEEEYAEARKFLERAVVHQKRAIELSADNAAYPRMLKVHYDHLLAVALCSNEAALLSATEAALADLAKSDPAKGDVDRKMAEAASRGTPIGTEELQLFGERLYELRMFAQATKYYSQALQGDPDLKEDRKRLLGYSAAFCAALAGCGLGLDNPKPDDSERARLRAQALTWLQKDLSHWEGKLSEASPETRSEILATLTSWHEDPDFLSVRDEKLLAKLPEFERQEWQKLWIAVSNTIEKVR